jgi:hypothetical protein
VVELSHAFVAALRCFDLDSGLMTPRGAEKHSAAMPLGWFQVFLGMTIAWLSTGCSSFERAWKESSLAASQPNRLTGRWEGSWHSDSNGHHDRLRCIVTPRSDGAYAARFQARYAKGLFHFRFDYVVALNAVPAQSTGEKLQFEGEADLGWYAGGLYRYKGFQESTNFYSTYQSKYDQGTFQMTRP